MDKVSLIELVRLSRGLSLTDPDIQAELLAEELGLQPKIEALDIDAWLAQRSADAGWIAPCINPECTNGEDGQRAMVDRQKRVSGACCREHMTYHCTHPKCVEAAAQKRWPKYLHRYDTKIGIAHYEYRSKDESR